MDEKDETEKWIIIQHKKTYQLCVSRDQKPAFSQQDQLPMGTNQETAARRVVFLYEGAASHISLHYHFLGIQDLSHLASPVTVMGDNCNELLIC